MDTDRRSEGRFGVERTVQYLPVKAAKDWHFLTGQLLDCSPHGVGMECGEPMAVGDDFILKVRLKKLRLLIYRTQNVSQRHNVYRVGGELIGALTEPNEFDLDELVESLAGIRKEDE
jgi:hypothetical protein